MSADLHIHIYEGVEESDLSKFFSNTLGSKHFNPSPLNFSMSEYNDPEGAWSKVTETPNIWIGEVSWLKASLIKGGAETFIPNTVSSINETIGEELPELTDELIGKLCAAFDLPNTTEYRITTADKVRAFLEEHRGKKVFTISW